MKNAVVFPVVFALAACAGSAAEEPEVVIDMPETALTEITADEWAALSSRRIFFGHQSVGRDITQGLERVLADHPEIGVAIRSTESDPHAVDGPAFIEARIGRNREPATKSAAFLDALQGGFGDEANAIAMYKFCYVDVTAETDPDRMFSDYVDTIETVRSEFPGLRIVHFTLPLKTADDGLKERVKTTLGMATETRRNIIRNRYNDLLRAEYGATDPIFDLALLESTRPDGSRAFGRYKGRDVYMLAPEWTSDGGHLNEAGKYHMAERLLVFLARLESNRSNEAAGAVAGS